MAARCTCAAGGVATAYWGPARGPVTRELCDRISTCPLRGVRRSPHNYLQNLDRRGVELVVWIPQDCGAGKLWIYLLKQLQPFGIEFGRHHREPGDVSTRMRQIPDQAGAMLQARHRLRAIGPGRVKTL